MRNHPQSATDSIPSGQCVKLGTELNRHGFKIAFIPFSDINKITISLTSDDKRFSDGQAAYLNTNGAEMEKETVGIRRQKKWPKKHTIQGSRLKMFADNIAPVKRASIAATTTTATTTTAAAAAATTTVTTTNAACELSMALPAATAQERVNMPERLLILDFDETTTNMHLYQLLSALMIKQSLPRELAIALGKYILDNSKYEEDTLPDLSGYGININDDKYTRFHDLIKNVLSGKLEQYKVTYGIKNKAELIHAVTKAVKNDIHIAWASFTVFPELIEYCKVIIVSESKITLSDKARSLIMDAPIAFGGPDTQYGDSLQQKLCPENIKNQSNHIYCAFNHYSTSTAMFDSNAGKLPYINALVTQIEKTHSVKIIKCCLVDDKESNTLVPNLPATMDFALETILVSDDTSYLRKIDDFVAQVDMLPSQAQSHTLSHDAGGGGAAAAANVQHSDDEIDENIRWRNSVYSRGSVHSLQ